MSKITDRNSAAIESALARFCGEFDRADSLSGPEANRVIANAAARLRGWLNREWPADGTNLGESHRGDGYTGSAVDPIKPQHAEKETAINAVFAFTYGAPGPGVHVSVRDIQAIRWERHTNAVLIYTGNVPKGRIADCTLAQIAQALEPASSKGINT